MKKKHNFKIGKREYGDIPLEDIILEYIVNKINREKGYEFVKIKKSSDVRGKVSNNG